MRIMFFLADIVLFLRIRRFLRTPVGNPLPLSRIPRHKKGPHLAWALRPGCVLVRVIMPATTLVRSPRRFALDRQWLPRSTPRASINEAKCAQPLRKVRPEVGSDFQSRV